MSGARSPRCGRRDAQPPSRIENDAPPYRKRRTSSEQSAKGSGGRLRQSKAGKCAPGGGLGRLAPAGTAPGRGGGPGTARRAHPQRRGGGGRPRAAGPGRPRAAGPGRPRRGTPPGGGRQRGGASPLVEAPRAGFAGGGTGGSSSHKNRAPGLGWGSSFVIRQLSPSYPAVNDFRGEKSETVLAAGETGRRPPAAPAGHPPTADRADRPSPAPGSRPRPRRPPDPGPPPPAGTGQRAPRPRAARSRGRAGCPPPTEPFRPGPGRKAKREKERRTTPMTRAPPL